MTLLRFSAIFGIGGSLLAVAVPTFLKNLSASKSVEALDGLDHIARRAIVSAAERPQRDSFPPSVGLTPAEVPRGTRVKDPPETWDHLTWRALSFRLENEHAYCFQFDSSLDPGSEVARFSARAFGDLDGDGTLSTFEVRGEREPGKAPRAMAGLLIRREVE
jgi:hypothetical protein